MANKNSLVISKKMKLLTVKNLYRQRCIMEIFKIIKYKVPVSMISLVRESERIIILNYGDNC